MAIVNNSLAGTGQSKTAGTTLAIAGGYTEVVGDFVVVIFAMDNAAGTVSAADDADGGSNTYTNEVDVTNAAGVRTVLLWAQLARVRAAGNLTITVTHPSVTARAGKASFWGGVATSSPLDQKNSGTTNGSTSTTSNAITPSVDGCLVIGGMGVEDTQDSFPATQPGWALTVGFSGTTTGGAASNITATGGYEIQTTATGRTYNPTIASADSAGVIASFKPAVAATKSPPPFQQHSQRMLNRRRAA